MGNQGRTAEGEEEGEHRSLVRGLRLRTRPWGTGGGAAQEALQDPPSASTGESAKLCASPAASTSPGRRGLLRVPGARTHLAGTGAHGPAPGWHLERDDNRAHFNPHPSRGK